MSLILIGGLVSIKIKFMFGFNLGGGKVDSKVVEFILPQNLLCVCLVLH